ncbi:PhzF family phenazine biosynthesis protein [Actinoplanes sp. URMC 104]|uniref:PhzF family phenazine biosynthesis protein n=1 Tax=Actinoplanes sp. URMC 104 TaxID=3423409 RepID=UPI003F1A84F6
MTLLDYTHVDVFATEPFQGNSLPVFCTTDGLTARQMLRVTQELRHFEAIFLQPTSQEQTWRARVFDLSTELPFAGHPLLGAAAVLHRAAAAGRSCDTSVRTWHIELPDRTVQLTTRRTGRGWRAVLDQGRPQFLGTVADRGAVAHAFGLDEGDLNQSLPVEVVSTGLRYLIVPVRPHVLAKARIAYDITPLVRAAGADFAVLFDESRLEIRHWTNDGVVEDIATGSAAGTIGAYRQRHGLDATGRQFDLRQGRFTGRPSILTIQARGAADGAETVLVGGPVAFVGSGSLHVPP